MTIASSSSKSSACEGPNVGDCAGPENCPFGRRIGVPDTMMEEARPWYATGRCFLRRKVFHLVSLIGTIDLCPGMDPGHALQERCTTLIQDLRCDSLRMGKIPIWSYHAETCPYCSGIPGMLLQEL